VKSISYLKNFADDSTSSHLDTTNLNTDTSKFESPQKEESKS